MTDPFINSWEVFFEETTVGKGFKALSWRAVNRIEGISILSSKTHWTKKNALQGWERLAKKAGFIWELNEAKNKEIKLTVEDELEKRKKIIESYAVDN